MASWSEFAAAAPWLADAIWRLVHQYGPGLGYLATVRPDGGPRVHPVAPVVTDQGLFCFVIDSPKRRDLERDGRYALHAFPPEDSDDEAYLAGRAHPVTDRRQVARVADLSRAEPGADWRLFEFTIDVAMLTRYPGSTPAASRSSGLRPSYHIWRDPAGSRTAARRGAAATGLTDRVQ